MADLKRVWRIAKGVYADLPGSWEAQQHEVQEAAQALLGSGGAYVCIVGTFADHVVVSVEGMGDEQAYSVPWTLNDVGDVMLGTPSPVEVQAVVVPDSDPSPLPGGNDMQSDDYAVAMSGDYRVAKADDSLQCVFGWANVAVRKSGEQVTDFHADRITPEELEVAAYDFTMTAGVSGEDHAGDVDAYLVESIALTKQKQAALGIPEGVMPEGWWLGFHIPDRGAYERAKTEKRMFSIEGTAKRVPVED